MSWFQDMRKRLDSMKDDVLGLRQQARAFGECGNPIVEDSLSARADSLEASILSIGKAISRKIAQQASAN